MITETTTTPILGQRLPLKQQLVTSETANKPIDDGDHHEGIVIYSDGGARPNPGKTGWGAHGFRYTTKQSNKGPGIGTQIVTTTGYLPTHQKSNPEVKIVTPIEYYDFFGSCPVSETNNAAEIDAVYYSLERLKSNPVKSIQIYTDSEYVRRGLEGWVDTWKERDWKRPDGTPIPNARNWKRLLDQLEYIRANNIDLRVNWVKGHNDNFGNTIADILATVGVMYSTDGKHLTECKISQPSGYWKNEVDRHPFINFKRMYFNSAAEHNVFGHYYIAEPGGDDYVIGKKMPESSYAVVKLKEIDPIVETIKNRQYEVANGINSIIRMELDRVYNPNIYKYIEEHGRYSLLNANKGRLGLNFADDEPITVELNPAGQSLRAIECFGLLEEILERYQNHRDGVANSRSTTTSFEVHDITSVFFDIEEKLKKKETVKEFKFKPEFVVGFKNIDVPVTITHRDQPHEIKIPLILGADLLPRNNLKRIESLNPKINLVTWKESECSIRYACVIETDSGIGIWSNFFADRIFLN